MRPTRDSFQDVNDLLRLAQDVISVEDYSTLLDLIVKRALALLGGDRGFLVLCRDGDLRFEVVRNWSVEDYEGGKEPVSRSIIQKVLARQEPLHIEDASSHPDFARRESVQELAIRSVLAAPILHDEERLGVLYLESRSPKRFFREEERALFSKLLQLTARALVASLQRLLLTERVTLLERGYLSRYKMPGIITQDERFARLLETVGQVSRSALPVLLQGASGTGKELLARTIHLNSARCKGPFVSLHCATTSPAALESELFGASKSAPNARAGLLPTAHQGTLFLDEISELPRELQPKLLRVIQSGEVLSSGATKPRMVDLRVIASTKLDLAQEVEEGRFREDLFYQLNAVTFQLPRLRERSNDILPLFYYFIRTLCEKEARPLPRVTPGLEKVIEGYSWPGNVRELENEVKRLLVLTPPGEWLSAERLSARILASPPVQSGRLLRLEEHEREAILQHLRAAEGNRSQAAETLGVTREGLRKMLKRHGLEGFRYEGEA